MSEALITLFTTLGEAFTQAAEDLAAEAEENDTPEPEPEPKKAAGRGRGKKESEPEPEPKKAAGRGKKKPEPEPEPEEDDPVTLEDLQELASSLLEAGQRKVLKGVLDEAGVKSLSAAEEDQYDDLYDALYDAVEALS